MIRKLLNLFRKSKVGLVGTAIAVSIAATATVSVAMPVIAQADACDKVNIVYCGLDGSSASGYINSFQAAYNLGSNNGHNDLKAVYRWAGASDSNVAGMTTANTKVGTMYRNGDIKVDGVIVGHDAQVAARFGAGMSGFTKIPGTDAWSRKTTTSLAEDTAKVIVHFDTSGNADFAVMVNCGNAVKFTPVPQPKPRLTCDNLTQSITSAPLTRKFTANASASHATIQSYTFTFTGGGATSTQVINSSATSVSTTHTFAKNDTSYTVSVVVKGVTNQQQPITAPACNLNFTTPKPSECKPGIPVGDSRCNECKPGIPVGDSHCTEECKPGIPMGDSRCNECRPGVPVGDSRCNECRPGVPEGSAECAPVVASASTLVNTGPGSITAVVGATSIAGAFGRYMFLRRKLNL